MGDHKREYCKSGRHKMEGHNVVTRTNGFRYCRACQLERNNRYKREQRKPQMHWGRFTFEELAAIHRAFVMAPTSMFPNTFAIHDRLLHELIRHIDERIQSENRQKLANQKEH